jgi:hypothetical protein
MWAGLPQMLFASRRFVELADVRHEAVLVDPHDQPGDELHDQADERPERPEQPGHRSAADTVAIEHLERPHRHPVCLGELGRLPQRLDLRELADDLLFDPARTADLLEQTTLLFGGTGPQHPKRVDSVEQLGMILACMWVVLETHQPPTVSKPAISKPTMPGEGDRARSARRVLDYLPLGNDPVPQGAQYQ